VRVYPATDEEVISVTEVEQFVVALFRGIACITSARLVGDHKMADEKSIRDDRPTEDATRFQVASGVHVSAV
jgi:hypothetical protein